MNRLSREQRCQIVRTLVEGNSIRATCRITGIAKGTVLKLLADLGPVCAAYEDDHLVNLETHRVECDEIWAFVHAKAKNVPVERQGEFGIGDVWTWTAIDAQSKLVINWTVGNRDTDTAVAFMRGVAKRLKHRVQLTTDGHRPYLYAVDDAFAGEVDYAQLIKLYGADKTAETRYSPAVCTGSKREVVVGSPDKGLISTSYVERQNLTMRMGMRRFTRLTNGFSKKAENLAYAVALHFMYYNFARPHQTLRGQTPAMAAGVADHVWEISEIVALLESTESSHNSN
jgi:IS1 family transposase